MSIKKKKKEMSIKKKKKCLSVQQVFLKKNLWRS